MRFLFLGLLLTQVFACSHLSPQNHNKQTHWELSGKIGITTPQESVAGFIRWRQNQDNFDIYVSGPLGAGNMQIQGNNQYAKLTQGGKTLSGIPATLFYEQLGWVFPIKNLPHWLQGRPAPFTQATSELNADGKLALLKQDNWTIEYLRYHPYYQLPSRIKIKQGKWKFLIVIKNWNLG